MNSRAYLSARFFGLRRKIHAAKRFLLGPRRRLSERDPTEKTQLRRPECRSQIPNANHPVVTIAIFSKISRCSINAATLSLGLVRASSRIHPAYFIDVNSWIKSAYG